MQKSLQSDKSEQKKLITKIQKFYMNIYKNTQILDEFHII